MKIKKLKLPQEIKNPVLALGSQRKNTICFASGDVAYLSPVHDDLNNPRDFLNFSGDLKHFLQKHPRIIAYDLHPEYQSSKYVSCLKPNTYQLIPIQHHHAHIASCMAENNLKNQQVIGIAFDGTGLGTDNHIWGAEFLICDYKGFKRMAHLKEIPLLGGEQAILEPWRIAAAWLYSLYKDKFLELNIGLAKKIEQKKWRVLKDMYLSGFNSPLASSAGRLFDAVASLIFAATRADSEAELAIRLEEAAKSYKSNTRGYNFKILREKSGYVLDPAPLFKELVSDLRDRADIAEMAYRFHLGVAQMIKSLSLILRQETKIIRVILSGGVFQNNLLLNLTLDLLYKEHFQVFTHRNLSCNDAGISLGQAVIAGSGS